MRSGPGLVTGSPPTVTEPVDGVLNPDTIFNKVDFPQPE